MPGVSTAMVGSPLQPAGATLNIAVYACALGTLILGIMPGWVLDLANKAALK